MRTRQKVALVLLGLVLLFFAIFSTPEAKAHTTDQEFLADITANGITVNNEAGTIDYAKWVCQGLKMGTKLYAMRDSVQQSQEDFTVELAEEFIGASVYYYCPDIIPPSVVKR